MLAGIFMNAAELARPDGLRRRRHLARPGPARRDGRKLRRRQPRRAAGHRRRGVPTLAGPAAGSRSRSATSRAPAMRLPPASSTRRCGASRPISRCAAASPPHTWRWPRTARCPSNWTGPALEAALSLVPEADMSGMNVPVRRSVQKRRAPSMSPSRPFEASAEVADALAAGKPLVALESTIITHGMPWPENLEMATGVEELIRAQGADAGDGRRDRRQAACRPRTEPARGAGRSAGRAEAVPCRPRLRRRREAHRLDHRGRDDDRRQARRHRRLRDRRHRRRPPRRRRELRHFGRSRRTGAHAGARRLGRRQGDPRRAEDAGSAGIARRAGRHLRQRRPFPPSGPAIRGCKARSACPTLPRSPASSAPAKRSASAAACWLQIRCPKKTRSRAPRWKATSPRRWRRPPAGASPARQSRPFLLSEIFRLTEGKSLETNIRLVRSNARLAAEIAAALAR